MISQFDPAQFLNQTTDQQSKRRPVLTAGAEFIGVLGAPDGRQSQGKKDPSRMYTFFDFPVQVDLSMYPDEAAAKAGITRVNLRYSVSLDVGPDGRTIDWSPGHNTGLRYLREATGMNEPGAPFHMGMLVGKPVRVRVGHEEYPEGSGELVERITGVAKP